MSGEPFHRCTHTALSPQGHIYASDGYGNSRVHKYTPDGKLLMSWGEPGTGDGEFNIVHNICCDADGWVYVADRENHRVQVFDGNGKFETQWQNLHRPCGLCMPYGHQPIFYVGEVGPAAAVSRDIPNLGPRVSIVDHQGKLIGRFGDTPAGTELGKFLAPHGAGAWLAGRQVAEAVGSSSHLTPRWLAEAGATTEIVDGCSLRRNLADVALERIALESLTGRISTNCDVPRSCLGYVPGAVDRERRPAAIAPTCRRISRANAEPPERPPDQPIIAPQLSPVIRLPPPPPQSWGRIERL